MAAAVRGHHGVPGAFQHLRERAADRGLVVHDQDVRGAGRSVAILESYRRTAVTTKRSPPAARWGRPYVARVERLRRWRGCLAVGS